MGAARKRIRHLARSGRGPDTRAATRKGPELIPLPPNVYEDAQGNRIAGSFFIGHKCIGIRAREARALAGGLVDAATAARLKRWGLADVVHGVAVLSLFGSEFIVACMREGRPAERVSFWPGSKTKRYVYKAPEHVDTRQQRRAEARRVAKAQRAT